MTHGKKTIFISTGGTGGHVSPAVVCANYFHNSNYNVILFTDNRGARYTEKLNQNIKTYNINYQIKSTNKIIKLLQLLKSIIYLSKKISYIYNKYKPCSVLSFGSSISIPVLFVAAIKKTKIFLHEQNTVLSKTNNLFASIAENLFISMPLADNNKYSNKTIVSKNPLPEIKFELFTDMVQVDKINILICGGSQGASFMDLQISLAIIKLNKQLKNKIHIIHQCRTENISKLMKRYKENEIHFTLTEYIYNMQAVMLESNLIIARAGAGTVSEILAYDKNAILIPYPMASQNHQVKNANFACKSSSKVIKIEQKEFNLDSFLFNISYILKNQTTYKRYNSDIIKKKQESAQEIILKQITLVTL